MSDLLLHGCAFAFERTVVYGDGFLRVAAKAFDRFLAAPDREVQLLFGGHDSNEIVASTGDRSLSLFAGAGGVWFRAVLADPHHNKCGLITRKLCPMNQASVNFLVTDEREDTFLGRRRCSILQAGTDHIAIVSRGAFAQHSAVWAPRAGLERAPERLQDFERRFEDMCASSSTQEFAHAKVGR